MSQVFDNRGYLVPPKSELERRSWPEDFGHENGNYFCTCSTCGDEFVGHKRRVTCKLCAGDVK